MGYVHTASPCIQLQSAMVLELVDAALQVVERTGIRKQSSAPARFGELCQVSGTAEAIRASRRCGVGDIAMTRCCSVARSSSQNCSAFAWANCIPPGPWH